MIAFLEGKMDAIDESSVFVVVNGTGYEVVCANPFQFQHLQNEFVRIYTYHYIREDQQILYGFKQYEEKQLFAKLLNVSGIGPKGALSILASTSVHDIAVAIEQEDEKLLTQFPGVGKKTARQMILDLKGKVAEWMNGSADIPQNASARGEGHPSDSNQEILNEALEALKALGYSDREIKRITPQLRQSDSTTIDEFVKNGLSLMVKKNS
ncbi:Holliday junction branch migration protein RuvA [Virgibacillus sp. MSP4-1]|uniref:Holliday junction branch migration protein RuvA n=1 Tax=Virgibacillus sp. MSP4-1 TaxID=2700081 RepID=UPI0003A90972|nr:Holliday junction branch migration protein RuvA [Virgibacillus sp. MSP4-1]QHS22887.1 Holliday junction branch migration protein RuvA [Virgibacillus sp. MSP4-1]